MRVVIAVSTMLTDPLSWFTQISKPHDPIYLNSLTFYSKYVLGKLTILCRCCSTVHQGRTIHLSYAGETKSRLSQYILRASLGNWWSAPHWGSGGRFKNPYELLSLRALKFQCCIKIKSFSIWERYLVWNFKWYLWSSTQNILPIHWKMWILNDLPNVCANTMPFLFADDTNLFISGRNSHELYEAANNDLNAISEWLQVNRLSLNVKKKLTTCYFLVPKLCQLMLNSKLKEKLFQKSQKRNS